MQINKMVVNGIEIISVDNDNIWFVNDPADCRKTKLYAGESLEDMKNKLQSF